MAPPEIPMTVDECERKHKATRWVTGSIFVMMALFMTGVAWAVVAGYEANDAARDADAKVKIHTATQTEVVKRIEHRLLSVDDDVKEIKAELKDQRKMIEDLWRKNGKP